MVLLEIHKILTQLIIKGGFTKKWLIYVYVTTLDTSRPDTSPAHHPRLSNELSPVL